MRYPYDGVLTMPPQAPRPQPIAYRPYGSYGTYYHIGPCWDEYVRRLDYAPHIDGVLERAKPGMVCPICHKPIGT